MSSVALHTAGAGRGTSGGAGHAADCKGRQRTSRMLSRKKLASVPAQACSRVQFSQMKSELLWNMKKKMNGAKSEATPCNVISLNITSSETITRRL